MQNSTKADHETIQKVLVAILTMVAAISVRLAGYILVQSGWRNESYYLNLLEITGKPPL